MKIDKEEVLHVADLARLALTEDETTLYTEQMGNILSYVEKLSALDTTDIAPSVQDTSEKGVLREDVVTPSLRRKNALQNAPEKDHGCFKVPRIIE
ncbi:MAG: Asp-tRNA(Asn)/Glu-tRNA(Gln) amidotransferase subunit GatC [Thermodesulfobacteriota bacterium]